MPNLALLCLPAFAILDRLWGSSWGFKGKKAAILAVALGAGFEAGGLYGLAMGFAWVAYRSLPFFAGSAAPRGPQILATVARHAVIVPVAWFAAQRLGVEPVQAATCFTAYVALATVLAAIYGLLTAGHERHGEAGGSENLVVELVRGAAFGAALWASAQPMAVLRGLVG